MDQVRIAQFLDLQEAQIASGMLQAQGFSVYLQNEQLGAVDWGIRQAIGGFGLWASEDEAAEAKAALAEVTAAKADFVPDPELAARPRPLSVRIMGWVFYSFAALVLAAVLWSIGQGLMGGG